MTNLLSRSFSHGLLCWTTVCQEDASAATVLGYRKYGPVIAAVAAGSPASPFALSERNGRDESAEWRLHAEHKIGPVALAARPGSSPPAGRASPAATASPPKTRVRFEGKRFEPPSAPWQW